MHNDFIVTIHALERFEERLPETLVEWLDESDRKNLLALNELDEWSEDDQDRYSEIAEKIGAAIHHEVMEAMNAGRISRIPPLELSNYDLSRWGQGKAQVAWTQDKTRGYVLIDTTDGLMVATVLTGQTREEALSRLYVTTKNLR